LSQKFSNDLTDTKYSFLEFSVAQIFSSIIDASVSNTTAIVTNKQTIWQYTMLAHCSLQ